jgi:hypothetical protein
MANMTKYDILFREKAILSRHPSAVSYEDAIIKERNIISSYLATLDGNNIKNFNAIEGDIKLWRYVNLPKFLDLLQSKTLYFTSTKLLRNDDRYENSMLYKDEIDKFENLFNPLDWRKDCIVLDTEEKISAICDLLLNEQFEKCCAYVNCWHINKYESHAMWKIYSDKYGVAIQTKYNKLMSSINPGDKKVQAKKVFYNNIRDMDYLDWLRQIAPSYLIKRSEYASESELRLFIGEINSPNIDLDCRPLNLKTVLLTIYRNQKNKKIHLVNGDLIIFDEKTRMSLSGSEEKPLSDGVKIDVNLDNLIEKIYISPYSPSYYREMI